MSTNSTTFNGRLTNDPVMRYTQAGGAVVNFTLLQNVGQKMTRLNCVLFASPEEMKAAPRTNQETGEPVLSRFEALMEYVRKGHDLTVTGRLQNNDYSSEQGGKVTRTFGMELVVLDYTNHTSKAEAVRILAAQEERQLNAQAEAEAAAVGQPAEQPAGQPEVVTV